MVSILTIFLFVGLWGTLAWPSSVCTQTVGKDVALRIIIGEAANQGLKGMVCVAEVLRRRGSSKGFCGLQSAHVDREGPAVWVMAAKPGNYPLIRIIQRAQTILKTSGNSENHGGQDIVSKPMNIEATFSIRNGHAPVVAAKAAANPDFPRIAIIR